MSDKRSATRNRTFLPARVAVAELGTVIDCTIRDLSESGARIQLSGSVTLPASFAVHIPKFDRTVRAKQRWRRGDFAGIAFSEDTTATQSPATAPDPGYVDKLEKEIARLRRVLEMIRADPTKLHELLDMAA